MVSMFSPQVTFQDSFRTTGPIRIIKKKLRFFFRGRENSGGSWGVGGGALCLDSIQVGCSGFELV